MPRRAKGPRLYYREVRHDKTGRLTHNAVWLIRDGGREISTGASVLADAERALADYITAKRDPRHDAGKDPFVADVLALYLADRILGGRTMNPARLREAKARIVRLDEAMGARRVSTLTPADFRRYAKGRGKAARRDLEDLRAAFNHAHTEHVIPSKIAVVMPERYEPRPRWLTRQEVARLLRTAWRMTQEGTTRHTARHVARFILVALYTGSRAGVVCGAALGPTIGRGYVDLDTGIFHRVPPGTKQTKKRAPPISLHPALVAHIRRWNEAAKRDQGRPLRSVIEWQGGSVKRINKAWRAVREAAGFGPDVVPHTIRHTAVSWALQAGGDRFALGGYVGMSQETLERVYGHHDMARASRVAGAIRGRTKDNRHSTATDMREHDENTSSANVAQTR